MASSSPDAATTTTKKADVLMVGTGEYTTGYVDGKAANSDKGAGVVALAMFDLRRRGKVDRVGMCGVNVSCCVNAVVVVVRASSPERKGTSAYRERAATSSPASPHDAPPISFDFHLSPFVLSSSFKSRLRLRRRPFVPPVFDGNEP